MLSVFPQLFRGKGYCFRNVRGVNTPPGTVYYFVNMSLALLIAKVFNSLTVFGRICPFICPSLVVVIERSYDIVCSDVVNHISHF